MACDYQAIRADNERRYGTDIGRIGPMLLANRYDDRTHFIFELLQNAEDALARRTNWRGPRAVEFVLTKDSLRFSHFGKPFDEADVRGICGIAESTKDLTAIGRFGIGFKSVYAFTSRPEIHSGEEDFAIESFVWPVGVAALARDRDQTLILVPIKISDKTGREEIAGGLERLGPSTLLFLRQIEEIRWVVRGGESGVYRRKEKNLAKGVRRVAVVSAEAGEPEVEEVWQVFSRPVSVRGGRLVGYVEIAFSLASGQTGRRRNIQRVERSPLVVFFPTVVETHLGFLVQGPYRTTPSRDNVPRSDSWNERLVRQTAGVVVEALSWFRDQGLLDAQVLQCLPLDSAKFGEGTMFGPVFEAIKGALKSKPLLPRHGSGYVSARNAKLARSQELRNLFSRSQLGSLFGQESKLSWLSADITQDRTPDLRQYLIRDLEVSELTLDAIIPKLNKRFLEAQSDKWIRSLYEYLNGQPAVRRRLDDVPIIRLEDRTHVARSINGQPQAFLPGAVSTDFPIVRKTVCATKPALEFLRSLGLTEPDPVDDVVRNVLPKYGNDKFKLDDAQYEADIARILTAFSTDSKGQRERLVNALRETAFIRAIDAGGGARRFAKPSELYLSTERLKELFSGIKGVAMVDDSHPCLRGEEVRELLEGCGAVRYLRPVEDASLDWEARKELRIQAGHPETSYQNDRITDWALSGLDSLLKSFQRIGSEKARTKAKLLWEELSHLEERRGKGVFEGKYSWTHYGTYEKTFDAAFVRMLNETSWVPGTNGALQRPEFVLFETLGWKPDPFLESKIRFKPPVIDQLAREAGIEPGVLDLLKKLGVTSEAELRERLGVPEADSASDKDGDGVDDAVKKLGITGTPTPPAPDPTAGDPRPSGGHGGAGGGSGTGGGKRTPGSSGGRPFISYVGTHPDDAGPDPDGLDQGARMALEAKAIELIRASEPQWQPTANHNPGFDLFELGPDARPIRWCEVKAMTGSLDDRPVGMSRTQFECARQHGSAYWLYAVERAGTQQARIVRIQDPAGKARTFTFDRGWLDVAEVDSESEEQEE